MPPLRKQNVSEDLQGAILSYLEVSSAQLHQAIYAQSR